MIQCIIFDLDGTLVDSETLCNQAFLDLLPDLSLPVEELLLRFRGRKFTEILQDIESILGHDLPKGFEPLYSAQVDALFASSLEAFPDVHSVLQSIEIKMCIASNGPQAKIASALEKTGLDRIFSERKFSSFDIGKWKPDPSLFLHAASEMGVSPSSCLVVEDSPVGVAAARAAGMTPLQFCHEASDIDGVDNFNAYRDFAEKLSRMSKAVLSELPNF